METKALTMIFAKNNLSYQCLDSFAEKAVFLLKFDMVSCTTDYIVQKCDIGSKLIYIYAVFPVKVPANKRSDMAVYTALFNNNLTFGCWELNMDDGMLRFRISYLYDETSACFEQIFMENLEQSIKFTNICSSGILSVIYADADPFDVFRKLTNRVDVSLN